MTAPVSPEPTRDERAASGFVRCGKCGGHWTWKDSPRDSWQSPYEATWDSEAAALTYLTEHVCGRRHMEFHKRSSGAR